MLGGLVKVHSFSLALTPNPNPNRNPNPNPTPNPSPTVAGALLTLALPWQVHSFSLVLLEVDESAL